MKRINRAQRFYETSEIKNENGFDPVKQFKTDVGKTDASGDNPALTVSRQYAKFAKDYFELNDIYQELQKCFYEAYGIWVQREYPEFTVLEVKELLGTRRYNRAVKLFRDSSIRTRLEEAGFNRVGFVTFINMLCYVIGRQSYPRD